MGQAAVARIAVAVATYAIDKLYDYQIPENLITRAKTGVRVTVPFGSGNRVSEGIILDLAETSQVTVLKSVATVLDDESVLKPEQIKLALWLRERYFCTFYEAVKTLLPAGLWYRVREVCTFKIDQETALASVKGARERAVLETLVSHGGIAEIDTIKLACGEDATSVVKKLCRKGFLSIQTEAKRKLSDKTAKRVTLAVRLEEALAVLESRRHPSPVCREVVHFLANTDSVYASDIRYFTGASARTLKSLENSGLVTITQEEVFRVPKGEDVAEAAPLWLTEEQQAVYDGIVGQMEEKTPFCSLLYGVTGSGKTAVYIRLLQETVRRGKRGMILVPEISLTPQMMARFSAYFGDRVVMLHSGLRLSERYDQWKRVRRGDVDLVLGTRSAIFAPLENMGLIILDEEHDDSYQSDNAPRYHAREIAKYLCVQQGAGLILGSATPSVESTFQAQRGVYQKWILHSRFNQQPLPRVMIVDLREEIRAGNAGAISAPLRRELAENLRRGEQSILFLNRRGNSRMLLCGECGTAPECPRCSTALTFHSANGRLMCHYCGYSEKARNICDSCGGIMKHVGMGTQRVEEELHALFPGTEILRMDADTVPAGHQKLLDEFETRKIPILLGTQMVAKGLDFDNVTLVGVLAADLSLYMDSYKAAERTFSLLTQVVGRAGRGKKDGRALIQTFTPDNEVIQSAAEQDYNCFYKEEIRIRRVRRCPPFADIFTLTVTGMQEEDVLRAATELRDAMRSALPPSTEGGVEILGPAPAPVVKVNNRYRYRVFWIGRSDHATRSMISFYIRAFYQKKGNRGMRLYVGCNGGD